MTDIRASLIADHRPRLADLIDPATGKIRRLVWAGIGIAVFQQLVGINIVFYYGSVLWQSVGFSENDSLKINILSGALSILAFISFPITTFSAIAFGAISGLTWLSTVPPTSALVALMFGTRWFATLYGFAFVSHQVGGFLGVWLGGIVFEQFGSYTWLWWLSILFGVLSALINLPIVEKPVPRAVAQPA